MPIPVLLPPGAQPIDNGISATAESFVAVIGRIFRSGTTGATLNTPPTLFPDGENPGIDPATGAPYLAPLIISTPEQQLFFRQLAIAIITAIGSGGGGGGGATFVDLVQFEAICPSGIAVGDLVRITIAGHVDRANPANISLMPVIGVVTAKATSTSCTVQTHGLVQGIYSGLAAGQMYYVGRTSSISPLPTPNPGEVLFWQAVGVALDPTTLILTPSLTMSRVAG